MSLDVFCQGFVAGDAAGPRTDVRALLRPHAVVEDDDFLRLRVGDGTADVYLSDDAMMVNHVTGTDPWDVVVAVARHADWVILPVGCPTCLTDPAQREHLPAGLDDDVVVVADGAALRAVIAGSQRGG